MVFSAQESIESTSSGRKRKRHRHGDFSSPQVHYEELGDDFMEPGYVDEEWVMENDCNGCSSSDEEDDLDGYRGSGSGYDTDTMLSELPRVRRCVRDIAQQIIEGSGCDGDCGDDDDDDDDIEWAQDQASTEVGCYGRARAVQSDDEDDNDGDYEKGDGQRDEENELGGMEEAASSYEMKIKEACVCSRPRGGGIVYTQGY